MQQTADGERGPRHGAERDVGVTFVEILITVVLLGTVVIGVLAASRAAIVASRTNRDAARVESALLAAAERVERAARDEGYTCDLSGPVYAAAQLKLGVTPDEVSEFAEIGYDHLTADGWVEGEACPDGGYQPNLVQRVRITMTSPDTGLTRTLEVLKGDV